MKLKYWDYKATITLITSLTIIICSFFYAKFREKRLQNANVLKVGFVYEGDESTPYTSNFIASQHEIEKIYKDRIKVIVKNNVTDTNCSYALDELIQEGCGLIFANSYNYQDDCKDYAKKYPEIQFCQATGDNSTNPVIPNYHTFMGEIYQGRYVSGVVAGLKLKELYDNGRITQEQLKIGYVAAFPYSEVISGYTAFLMGIRSIVPEAKMFVKYSYSWSNYTIERS